MEKKEEEMIALINNETGIIQIGQWCRSQTSWRKIDILGQNDRFGIYYTKTDYLKYDSWTILGDF